MVVTVDKPQEGAIVDAADVPPCTHCGGKRWIDDRCYGCFRGLLADAVARARWLLQGHCEFIHTTKWWCNDDLGHVGPHWAMRLMGDGTERREVLR